MARSSTEKTARRYDRNARFYNLLTRGEERTFAPLRKELWSRAEGNVLEVGVGTGHNMAFYPESARITAIDLSPKMLAQAERHAESTGARVDLHPGDVQNLAFPDGSFDTVLATFVFCSVPDPARGLQEVRRILKPGGKLLLLEHVRIDRPVIGFLMDLLNPIAARISGANINRRTVETVKDAGFQIEALSSHGPLGIVKMIQGHALRVR